MCKFTHYLLSLPIIAAVLLLAGCSSTRHVPNGSYLLDKVDIEIEGDDEVTVSATLRCLTTEDPSRFADMASLFLGRPVDASRVTLA